MTKLRSAEEMKPKVIRNYYDFKESLTKIVNIHGIDSDLDIADWQIADILADHLRNLLGLFNMRDTNRKFRQDTEQK